MGLWDDVEDNLASSEETANFGARIESGNALYQVQTLAVISSTEEVRENPTVCAVSVDDTVCVAAGENLTIFDNNGSSHVQIKLDSEVNCLALSCDGTVLVAGEQSGNLHFIHVTSRKTFLSKKIVASDGTSDASTFRSIVFTETDTSGVYHMTVAVENKIFHCRGLKVQAMVDAFEVNETEALRELYTSLKLSVVDVSAEHDSCSCALMRTANDCLLVSGDGDNVLSCWRPDGEMWAPAAQIPANTLTDSGIKKSCMVPNRNNLLILSEKGTLSVWSTHTFTVMQRWDMHVADFIVMDEGEDNIRVVVLLKPEDGACVLHVCAFPSLESVYSLQLSSHTAIATCLSFQETILFVVEGICENSDLVSNLRVRNLTETQPQMRLHRLLHKKRFDEAETFAQQFGLDVELVHKVKSNHLLDRLAAWRVDELPEEEVCATLQELRQCLENIQDAQQIFNCCTEVRPTTCEDMFHFLRYARTWLEKQPEDESGDIARWATQVRQLLHRLETFNSAFGHRGFSGKQWDRFSETDLLREFIGWLEQGRMEIAFTIWKRHQPEFSTTEADIPKILACVPEHALLEEIESWLSVHFIPFVAKKHRDSLSDVASWIEVRARNMELIEKTEWPENSLRMCQLLDAAGVGSLFRHDELGASSLDSTVDFKALKSSAETCDDPFVRLKRLSQQLQDLVQLHRTYNCRLSLAEFAEQTTETLAFRMLDRVPAPQLVGVAIETTVRPYMSAFNLDHDSTLNKYVENLSERFKGEVSVFGEAPWEGKAIAVIACIHKPELKCRATVEAARKANVPWSEDIAELVKQTLQLNHPRTKDLKEEVKRVAFKEILIQYNRKYFHVTQPREAAALVELIIQEDQPTALEDALEVARACESFVDVVSVYSRRANFLLMRDRLPELYDMMKALNRDHFLGVAKRLLWNSIDDLNSGHILYKSEEDAQLKQRVARVTCEILKKDQRANPREVGLDRSKKLLHHLENIRDIQSEFGEFVSWDDYHDEGFRTALIKKYVEKFYQSTNEPQIQQLSADPDRNPSRSQSLGVSALCRLAELLLVPREMLQGRIAVTFANSDVLNSVDIATSMCSELCEASDRVSPATAKVLFDVATALFKRIDPENPNSELLDTLLEFAQLACSHCTKDLVQPCWELVKSIELAGELVRKSSGMLDADGDPELSKSICEAWGFDPDPSEDTILLDMDECLVPPVQDYHRAAQAIVQPEQTSKPAEQNAERDVEKLASAGRKLCKLLREKEQHRLALRVCHDMLGKALCYVHGKDVGNWESDSSRERKTPLQFVTNMVEKASPVVNEVSVCLVKKAVKQMRFDHKLVLGYLLTLERSLAVETLVTLGRETKRRYKRAKNLAQVGRKFAQLTKQRKLEQTCRDEETDAAWGHRLSKLKNVDYDSVFRQKDTEKGTLLPSICRDPNVTVELIRDFCRQFRLSGENEALFICLETLLTSSDAQQTRTLDEILWEAERVLDFLDSVPDSDKFAQLATIRDKVNPYDYERMRFLLEAMLATDEVSRVADDKTRTGMELLDYLSKYKRVAAAGESECHRASRDLRELPAAAQERLPFHQLLFGPSPMDIIGPELNFATISAWFRVADVLQLKADDLCTLTIRNEVRQYVQERQSEAGAGWEAAQPRERGDAPVEAWDNAPAPKLLFKQLQEHLVHIADPETASCCAHKDVMQQLPDGAAKVAALQICFSLSQNWFKAAQGGPQDKAEEAERAVKRHKRLLRELATQQVLREHGLRAELAANVSDWSKLICELYEHPSVEKRGAHSSEHLPDIHKVAEELAAIYKKSKEDLKHIRGKLLNMWLPSARARKQNLDMTVTEDSAAPRSEASLCDEDERNLQRVFYLLQAGSLEENACFLIYFSQDERRSYRCKQRAIDCLFALVDSETINKVIGSPGNPVADVRKFKRILPYLVELEDINYPNIPKPIKFDRVDKTNLVAQLHKWSPRMDRRTQERTAKLMARIMIDYEVNDETLWNNVLDLLLSFKQFECLQGLLVELSAASRLWRQQRVQHVWQSVLETGLTAVEEAAAPGDPPGDDQLRVCAEYANLLLSCPNMWDLNLDSLAGLFVEKQAVACALLCHVQLSEAHEREARVHDLLRTHAVGILDQLAAYRHLGTAFPRTDEISETVHLYIEEKKKYGALQGTEHEDDFVEWLVASERLNDALVFGVRHKQLTSCYKLLRQYEKYHPQDEMCAVKENAEKLVMYLKRENLLDEMKPHLPEEFFATEEEVTDTSQVSVDSQDLAY